ncbi:cytoskeleton-associated protein 2-like isoform X2 [Alosa sapidissima]|uniref:cytoskeleton-associated protein 2-like isoform X2 n=1 Tax=Alosa sapidissima TaxID=34773 RepID=UPI001C092076|nr:cytoskeleton-associated protein 2-like isoform X2 [Alosa sapidissima]
MDGIEIGPKLSGAEMRKQKLMEYLASKGRLKPPNPKPYLRDGLDPKKISTRRTHLEKENQMPNSSTLKNGMQKAHSYNPISKTVQKPQQKIPQQPVVSKRAPLASGKCFTTQTRTLVSGRVVQQELLKTQQRPSSTHAGVVPNRVQSRQKNSGSACQTTNGSMQANKAPFHTCKTPLVSILLNHTESKTLQRRVVAQKKSQQTLKTVGRTDSVGANGESAPKSCTNSRLSQVTSKDFKGVEQRLTSNNSTKCNAKSIKPLDNKTQKRTVSTSILSRGSNVVSQASKLRPLGQGSTLVKDISQTSTLHSGVLKDNQKPTALGRKPLASVVSKPAKTAVSRTSNTPASSNAPQTKARAGGPLAALRPRTATTAKASTFSLPPPESRPRCRPATAPAAITKTVPRLGKSTGPLLVPDYLKTPAMQSRPRTVGPGTELKSTQKKSTAAQEERLRKLQEWREAKGISYKRPPMPIRKSMRKSVALHQHYWAAMEEEDDLHSLVCAVDRSLTDCLQLLEEGCPSEQVVEVLSRVPMAQKFCKYWICQVRLMEREGNYEVLPLFEEAVRLVREPVDDLRAVVFDILKKKETKGNLIKGTMIKEETLDEEEEVAAITEQQNNILSTPKAVGALIRGVKGDSSVVKYKITATPGQRSQHQEPLHVDGQEVRFLTPVRRSVRIERSAPRYPSALQEQDPCVASFRDLQSSSVAVAASSFPTEKSPLYIYRENKALKDQVQVQLFQEES